MTPSLNQLEIKEGHGEKGCDETVGADLQRETIGWKDGPQDKFTQKWKILGECVIKWKNIFIFAFAYKN